MKPKKKVAKPVSVPRTGSGPLNALDGSFPGDTEEEEDNETEEESMAVAISELSHPGWHNIRRDGTVRGHSRR